jgi:hypothetical protein
VVWTGLSWLRIGPVEGSCEHGNEPSGSIKCWEVLEYVHNWQLLKKGSAPWSRLVTDISALRVILTTNKWHQLVSLCSGNVVCFLWGMNWHFKYHLHIFGGRVSIRKVLRPPVSTHVLSVFLCVQLNAEMVPRFPVATACFSCRPPSLSSSKLSSICCQTIRLFFSDPPDLVSQFPNVALHAPYAALPMLTATYRPNATRPILKQNLNPVGLPHC